MKKGVQERTLAILEILAQHAEGLELATISNGLKIPKSAVHRLLSELVVSGYVRQLREHGPYVLTTRLVSLGLTFLSNSGVVDIAQPILNRLADISAELVRLSVVDGNRLTWIAKAQGTRQGLRYDPDMGSDAKFSCSSTGWAFMSTFSDEEVVVKVNQQGMGSVSDFGPNAPQSIGDLLEFVRETRQRGYSITEETYAHGLNALSAPVRLKEQPALGVLTIAGPSFRLTRSKMLQLGKELLSCADQLAATSGASPFFNQSQNYIDQNLRQELKPIYAE